MKPLRVLWLPSWYPHKLEPFNGDFIQRHAQAASLRHHVHVLFVKPMHMMNTDVEEVATTSGKLTEQIIYIKKGHGLLKNFSRIRVLLVYKKYIEHYIAENGKPALVHVHVLWPAGLVALWLKRRFGINYVITEHQGIYNNEVENAFSRQPFIAKKALAFIYHKASGFASVSRYIAENMNAFFEKKEYTVIPNVVDTKHFYPSDKKEQKFTFIHVSNMVALKNVEGILRAFKAFSKTHTDVQLLMVGNQDSYYPCLAQKLELQPHQVHFAGEVAYAAVAARMRVAHCLIVNSVMENAPCVICEALCCGVPVISTGVGGIPEMLDASNSIVLPANNDVALLAAMQTMYGVFKKFEAATIALKAVEKYSYDEVAELFDQFYRRIQNST